MTGASATTAGVPAMVPPRDTASILARVRACAWIARSNAARRDVQLSALFMSLFVVIVVGALGSMWHATVGRHHALAGYTPSMLVWYIAIAETSVISLNNRLLIDLGEAIRDGEIAMLLLRPLSLPAMLASEELGRALARAACVLPTACGVAWVLAGPPPSWLGLAASFLLIPMAMLLNIQFSLCLSASTFWLGDSRAMWFLQQKVIFLVGGMLLPLEFWPGGSVDVLRLLPTAGMAYWPAHAAVTGRALDVVTGLALQLAWNVAFALLAREVFRRGERRIVVAGG